MVELYGDTTGISRTYRCFRGISPLDKHNNVVGDHTCGSYQTTVGMLINLPNHGRNTVVRYRSYSVTEDTAVILLLSSLVYTVSP